MSLNERISKILDYSGMSPSEFADAVDVQRSSISHITSGRNKPSLEFITKIKNRFPEIQWEWIINGEGEMRTENQAAKQEEKKPPTLPDLFSLIDDENFGKAESEDKLQKEIPRDLPKTEPAPVRQEISDSRRLEDSGDKKFTQNIENQENKIKRIVIFFENGKFESFEP